MVSWGLLDLVDRTSHLTCPMIDSQHGTFMHETWQSPLVAAATRRPGFARPLKTNLNRIPASAERGDTTERMPWLSSHKDRNGDQGRRDPGFFRRSAASGNSFLERVETNQQRMRGASHPLALSELHRQSPKFHRVPRNSSPSPPAIDKSNAPTPKFRFPPHPRSTRHRQANPDPKKPRS